jgi:PAS domain S-box-containing protein
MIGELERAGLRPGWTWAQTRDEFLAGLKAGPDLILCDYAPPKFDARSALELLQESGLGIPLIVVTGAVSDEVAVECVRAGASDYLLKDRLARLAPAVLQALERKFFRELVERLPAVVYLWAAGADGQCYYVSPAIGSIFGYPVREWLADSRLWESRLHPEDRDWVMDQRLRSRENGEDLASEYRMLTRDGSVVWVREQAVMIRDEEASPHHLQGLMYDITAEKQARASLPGREGRSVLGSLGGS